MNIMNYIQVCIIESQRIHFAPGLYFSKGGKENETVQNNNNKTNFIKSLVVATEYFDILARLTVLTHNSSLVRHVRSSIDYKHAWLTKLNR